MTKFPKTERPRARALSTEDRRRLLRQEYKVEEVRPRNPSCSRKRSGLSFIGFVRRRLLNEKQSKSDSVKVNEQRKVSQTVSSASSTDPAPREEKEEDTLTVYEVAEEKKTLRKPSVNLDAGQRFLAYNGHPGTKSPKVKAHMEVRMKKSLFQFKSLIKEFSDVMFFKDWVKSMEEEIDLVKHNTIDFKSRQLSQYITRLEVRELTASEKPDDSMIGLTVVADKQEIPGASVSYETSGGERSNATPCNFDPAESWINDENTDTLVETVHGVETKPLHVFTADLSAEIEQDMDSTTFSAATEALINPACSILSVQYVLDESTVGSHLYRKQVPFRMTRITRDAFLMKAVILLKPAYEPRRFEVLQYVSIKKLEENRFIKVCARDIQRNEEVELTFQFNVKCCEATDVLVPEMRRQIQKEKEEDIINSVLAGERVAKSGVAMAKFMRNKPETDYQPALGSIMAVMLHNSEYSKTSRLKKRMFESYLRKAKQRLRYITLDPATLAAGFDKFMHLGLRNRLPEDESPLSLSCEVADSGEEIDYFVSHCWSDNIDEKITKLKQFSQDFLQKNGRYPRLWLDLFCADQDAAEIARNVQLLPVFLMSCKKLLMLRSARLLTRLWCLTEIYTRFILTNGGQGSNNSIEVINLEGYDSTALFDCSQASCSSVQDSILLKKKLNQCPGGLFRVNQVITQALISAVPADV